MDNLTKKRIEKRLKKSLLVNISGDDFDELGLTGNVSRQGLLLVTSNPIPPKNQLSILVAVGEEIFSITGEIKWMMVSTDNHTGNVANQIGVKIKSAPEEYIKYIEEIIRSRTAEKKPVAKNK